MVWHGCNIVVMIKNLIHRSMINVRFVVIIDPLYAVFKLFAINNNIEVSSSIRGKLPKNDVF